MLCTSRIWFVVCALLIATSFFHLVALVDMMVSQRVQIIKTLSLVEGRAAAQGQSPCRLSKWKPERVAPLTEAFRPLTDHKINGTACILVFSAYYDRRKKTVEIIADVNKKCYNSSSWQLPCLVWYSHRETPYLSPLRLGYFATHHAYRKPRVGVVYSCSVDASSDEDPYAVTVTPAQGSCQLPENATTLNIYYPDSEKSVFAVCTPPLFGKIEPQRLIEFIEMHSHLGASKFYFYNASAPASISKLLMQYSKEGIVQVIQWQSWYPNEVFYNNQAIMQVDCMYRNMKKANYVAQLDFDEVLMPRLKGASWTSLAAKWLRNDTAALVFLNRFYSTDGSIRCPGSNESNKAILTQSLSYVKRLTYYNNSYKPGERSKVMYCPERVLNIWTHFVTPYRGYKSHVLDAQDGILHHYRSFTWKLNSTSTDYHMCGFEKVLLQRIAKRFSLLS